MTRIAREIVECRLCGRQSRHSILLSSNTLGAAPGLDGRPGGMLRLTMKSWVQRCAGCGYCAPDLSAATLNDLPVTRVLEYDGESVTLEESLMDPPPA